MICVTSRLTSFCVIQKLPLNGLLFQKTFKPFFPELSWRKSRSKCFHVIFQCLIKMSKILGRQPSKKNWRDMVCLSRPYSFKFFKGCLPIILLGPISICITLNFFLTTLYKFNSVHFWILSPNIPSVKSMPSQIITWKMVEPALTRVYWSDLLTLFYLIYMYWWELVNILAISAALPRRTLNPKII